MGAGPIIKLIQAARASSPLCPYQYSSGLTYSSQPFKILRVWVTAQPHTWVGPCSAHMASSQGEPQERVAFSLLLLHTTAGCAVCRQAPLELRTRHVCSLSSYLGELLCLHFWRRGSSSFCLQFFYLFVQGRDLGLCMKFYFFNFAFSSFFFFLSLGKKDNKCEFIT